MGSSLVNYPSSPPTSYRDSSTDSRHRRSRTSPKKSYVLLSFQRVLNPIYTMQPAVKPISHPVGQPVVLCIQTSNRLSNWLYNWRFSCTAGWTTGNWLHRINEHATCCQTYLTTGWMFVYTMQPVIQPVVLLV